MRKVWLLALCLAALLALSGCAAAREAETLTVVLATDMHYLSPELTDYGGRFMNTVYASDGKVIHYSPQICGAFVRDMLAEKPWNMNHFDFDTGAAANKILRNCNKPVPCLVYIIETTECVLMEGSNAR